MDVPTLTPQLPPRPGQGLLALSLGPTHTHTRLGPAPKGGGFGHPGQDVTPGPKALGSEASCPPYNAGDEAPVSPSARELGSWPARLSPWGPIKAVSLLTSGTKEY